MPRRCHDMDISSYPHAIYRCLVYIAGWSFLVAGMIVLVVILRGSRM